MVSLAGLLPAPTSASSHETSHVYIPSFQSTERAAAMLSPTASASIFSEMTPSTTVAIMIAVASTVSANPNENPQDGNEDEECQLLGPFALIIQAALGALALLSLVYKRWRERPQRPVKIWAFDASKQVVGSMLLHVANLLMSMLSSGQFTVKPTTAAGYHANPCSFYLLNLAIDTTVGIPILIILLRLLTHAFSLTPLGDPPESIQSGNYGQPPKATWWLKQSFIYFLGLLGMKFCVFVIFQLCPWIIRVGDWALKWTQGNKHVQVFFVMLFFPVIMNALQYYIIDGFIKNQKPADHEQIPSEDEEDEGLDGHENHRRTGSRSLRNRLDENSDTAVDEIDTPKTADDRKLLARKLSRDSKDVKLLDEYNPATDGERTASSSSSSLKEQEELSEASKDGVANRKRTSTSDSN